MQVQLPSKPLEVSCNVLEKEPGVALLGMVCIFVVTNHTTLLYTIHSQSWDGIVGIHMFEYE